MSKILCNSICALFVVMCVCVPAMKSVTGINNNSETRDGEQYTFLVTITGRRRSLMATGNRGYKNPPLFDGGKDYEIGKTEMKMLILITSLEKNKQAPAVLLSLRDGWIDHSGHQLSPL